MNEIKMIVNFYSTYRSFSLTPKAAHRRCYVCNKCPEQHSGRKYHRAWKGELIRISFFRAGERWRRLEHNHIIVLDGKIREYYASITLLRGLISLYLFKFTSHHFLFSLSVWLEGAEFIYSQLCAFLVCLFYRYRLYSLWKFAQPMKFMRFEREFLLCRNQISWFARSHRRRCHRYMSFLFIAVIGNRAFIFPTFVGVNSSRNKLFTSQGETFLLASTLDVNNFRVIKSETMSQ